MGLVQSAIPIDDPLFHRREITLFATRNSANDFPRIIRTIEQGLVDTSPWITHRMTLLDVPALFPDLPRQRDCVKAMIEVPGA